jgi:hydroxyethylthiazole kinase-like uncharacterized protein yjeF
VKTYTAAQVRRAEQPLLAAGVPLMARASAALAAETRSLLTRSGRTMNGARLLVLVGAGNNGGDALFAAAELAASGSIVTIAKTADRVHEQGLAAALAAGAAELESVNEILDVARECDVVLDGILGTGTSAHPALRGRARELVSGIRSVIDAEGRPLVIAVDLPSGTGADDGAVPDPTVLAATVTVTFGGCKAGLLLEPAARYAGRVIVADIGLGPELERITAAAAAARGERQEPTTTGPRCPA